MLSGSPAINAGGGVTSNFRVIDQRGAIRVVNGGLDIGAVEGIFFGPQVADVILSSSSFSTNFVDAIDGAGTSDGNGLGYSLVRNEQLVTVPWQNIDTLYLQFLTDVSASLDDGDILLTGTNGGNYSLGPISFDTDSFVATVPILGGIGNDSLVVSIFAGTVVDTNGESVVGNDGEQFNFFFNVLPGDEDGSGQVTAQDAFNVFASNADLTITENARRDIDGSGQVNASDSLATFANNTNGLPAPPTAPVPPAALTSAPRVTKIDAVFDDQPLREDPAGEYVLIQTHTSKEVFPEATTKDDVPPKTPASDDVISELPASDVAFVSRPLSVGFSDSPVINDVVFAKVPERVEPTTQSLGNEPVAAVLEPRQPMAFRTPLFSPRNVGLSVANRFTKTFTSEPDRVNLSPEFTLAGNIKIRVAKETKRDYFAGESQTQVELDPSALDAIFEANVSNGLEFDAVL